MDRMAYLEQRDERKAEDRYQLGLERAATGEGAAAYALGVQRQQADPTSPLWQDPNKPVGLARGGLAQARRPYLVGEKGPELMVPDQNGTIIPNHRLQILKNRAISRCKGGLVVAARARGGFVQAGGDPDVAARAADDIRGTGTLTHYRPIAHQGANGEMITWAAPGGDVGRQGAAPAPNLGDASLGAPTSFAGGEGAPTPIENMGKGFVNPEGGPVYKTLQQAGQAYNRGVGVGKYVPPEGPKIEALGEQQRLSQAAELKRPDLVAKAEADRAAQAEKTGETHVATLKNYLANTFGTFDSATNRMAFKPTDENTARDALASEEVARRTPIDGGHAAITHFQDRQAIRSYLATNPFKLPEGWDVNRYIGALSQNPAAWAEMVKEGQAKRLTAPAVPAEPGAMQQLGMIGKAVTPEWMKPKPGVNY